MFSCSRAKTPRARMTSPHAASAAETHRLSARARDRFDSGKRPRCACATAITANHGTAKSDSRWGGCAGPSRVNTSLYIPRHAKDSASRSLNFNAQVGWDTLKSSAFFSDSFCDFWRSPRRNISRALLKAAGGLTGTEHEKPPARLNQHNVIARVGFFHWT